MNTFLEEIIEVLEFYSNLESYEGWADAPTMSDRGDKARKLLEKLKKNDDFD